jgi:tRNA A37 methylthiotransferase MiaB
MKSIKNIPKTEVLNVVEQALLDGASEIVVTKQANGQYTVNYRKL